MGLALNPSDCKIIASVKEINKGKEEKRAH